MNRRRFKFSVLITGILLLLLAGACGLWVYAQQRQYARNRQLIEALVRNDGKQAIALRHKPYPGISTPPDTLIRNDGKQAIALVNEGADPNTPFKPTPLPSLPELLRQLFHRSPPPANDSPTAFLIVCGAPVFTDNGRKGLLAYGSDDALMVQAMLTHGANVNARSSSAKGSETALLEAVLARRWNTAGVLLEHGADVNAKDNRGLTPLMLVRHSPGLVRLLLEHGADVNAKDNGGWTPLMNAAEDNAASVRLLLEHGADPNAQDINGWTPLTCATEVHASPDVVRLLLEHGADPNWKDNRGWTPLMIAPPSPGLVRLLLEHGAEVNVKDNSGQTPLMYAQGHSDVVALLRHAGARR